MAMTLLTLKEDRPTPKAVYNWRVYVCAAVASFASCTIGYDSAFIGTTLALPSFIDEFNFAEYSDSKLALTKQNIVSVYQAGAFFGSLAAFGSSFYLGRRKSLALFTTIFVLGAGLMLGANGSRGLGLIIGGRVLAGFGIGGCSNMTPIYISELSPPAVRGRLVGIYELGWQIGGLVGFWINYGVNETLAPTHKQWLIPFAVQLIPAGLLLCGIMFVPESPRWLFLKGRREEAMKILCWMRNLEPNDIYIVEEVAYIDEDLDRYHNEVGAGFFKPFRALKERHIQYRFLLGALLFVFQNGKLFIYRLLCSKRLTLPSVRFRYQCHQLLQPDRFQEHRRHRHKHKSPHHRHLRCRQDGSYHHLASLPHRPHGTTQLAHGWRFRWLDLHVVHRCLHQGQGCSKG